MASKEKHKDVKTDPSNGISQETFATASWTMEEETFGQVPLDFWQQLRILQKMASLLQMLRTNMEMVRNIWGNFWNESYFFRIKIYASFRNSNNKKDILATVTHYILLDDQDKQNFNNLK